MMQAQTEKSNAVDEMERLKERLAASNAQISRQRTLVDESRARLNNEKKKTDGVTTTER